MGSPLVSTDRLKEELLRLMPGLVHDLAPPAAGHHTTDGRYWTLNPGRADRAVGSFYVQMTGADRGRWHDFATGDHGDLIDLIGLRHNLPPREAFAEARRIAGLEADTPQSAAEREARARDAQARRNREERARREQLERRRRAAAALFLSARERIAGTPVEHYLRGRGLDLAALGRQPRALRYHPACRYREERMDPDTGEVTELRLELPAMVAAITRGGQIVACHRTWLAYGADGRWTKAPLAAPKKELGDPRGGAINLWSGAGPRGGKGAPLGACPPGSRVYIAEGIETALSAVMLHPGARVIAAGTLGNMAAVQLPGNVAEVVLVQDHDESAEAQKAFARAVAAHAAADRLVRVYRPDRPGEDLNDELRRELMEGAA